MTPEPYDLNRPAHLIANELLRRLERILAENEINVRFEGQAREEVEQLVRQYKEKQARWERTW